MIPWPEDHAPWCNSLGPGTTTGCDCKQKSTAISATSFWKSEKPAEQLNRQQRRAKKKHRKKQSNTLVTKELLDSRTTVKFGQPKWSIFCETMMLRGFTCHLYEARQTYSKYITVTLAGDQRSFKVRFSNHKPIHAREMRGDCDFFVGMTHTGVRNTYDAVLATLEFFSHA